MEEEKKDGSLDVEKSAERIEVENHESSPKVDANTRDSRLEGGDSRLEGGDSRLEGGDSRPEGGDSRPEGGDSRPVGRDRQRFFGNSRRGRGDRNRGDRGRRGGRDRRPGKNDSRARGDQRPSLDRSSEPRRERRNERSNDNRNPRRNERRNDRRGEYRGGRTNRLSKPEEVKREILANTSFEETRVAILENERLVELLWERRSSKSIVGNIYKGKIENVLPGISSAFINIGFEKNAYLYISDVLGDTRKPIDHLLKKGQDVMIQVAKESIGTKGMKVTMEVSLPGRYLVFTPTQQSVGISKHISDPVERKRIAEIMDRLMKDTLKGLGVVVRTEAEGASEEDLRREASFLVQNWEEIDKKFKENESPSLLHQDHDLPIQIARDVLNDSVYVYLFDKRSDYEAVSNFVDKLCPDLKNRIRYYDAKTPIFTAFNIEPEIEKLRQIKVSLPSGGTIVIQEAESLCAIDVNTGRFTGSKTQEETVTLNNVEAAIEVAHQLRLRNIGGIIVVDFIDMKKASNRQKVMEAFARAVKNDRAKIRILPITRLGLIEMTRERRKESTISLMTDECPGCFGSGRVLSAESVRIRVQREIFELTQGRPGGNIRLVLHPVLSDVFKAKQAIIEKNVHRSVQIDTDANLQYEDYRIILE